LVRSIVCQQSQRGSYQGITLPQFLRGMVAARSRNKETERNSLGIPVSEFSIGSLRKEEDTPVCRQTCQSLASMRHLLDYLVPQQLAKTGADLRELLSVSRRNRSPLEEVDYERQQSRRCFQLRTRRLDLALKGDDLADDLTVAPQAEGVATYTGQELASKAKVKIDNARAIALKARPGAITSEELEKEKGGSGLRYSFGVKSGKALYEVGVDTQTGKVLENSKEGKHPD
jgi:uncharacterized membrane protein YkoI